jgi:hypothetical protein
MWKVQLGIENDGEKVYPADPELFQEAEQPSGP